MGLSGFTNENISLIFKSPYTILLVFLCIVSLGLLVLVQILAMFSLSINNNLKSMFEPLKRIKLKDLLPLILYTLLIIPFNNMSVTILFVSDLRIPYFILAVVKSNTILNIIYSLVLLFILFINLRLFYTFIIFYTKKVSFSEAMKLSIEETKHKSVKIITFNLFLGLLPISASIIDAIIYFVFNNLALLLPSAERILVSLGASMMVMITLASILVATIYFNQYIILSYDSSLVKPSQSKIKNGIKILVALTTALVFTYSFLIYTRPTDLNKVQIISHRGEMANAVENTFESLMAAKEKGVDYVELDVQQLKDGTFIVYHDATFKRLTSLGSRVEDVTWDEIKDLELRDRGISSKIPRFDEYLKVAKDIDQKLLIEVKTNPKDSDDFEEEILKMVNDAGMREMVLYQSLHKDTVLRIEEIDPSAYTSYIISLNVGGLEYLDVDAYALDEFSVTRLTVLEAALYEKDLYIWSLYTPDVIQKALSKSPAGVVTDEIDLVEEVIEQLMNQPMSRMLWLLNF